MLDYQEYVKTSKAIREEAPIESLMEELRSNRTVPIETKKDVATVYNYFINGKFSIRTIKSTAGYSIYTFGIPYNPGVSLIFQISRAEIAGNPDRRNIEEELLSERKMHSDLPANILTEILRKAELE